MSHTFSLVDAYALGDLRVFLGRAGRVEDGSVRLISSAGILAVYVAVLYPLGLLDETPTVLGLRTLALTERADFDAVVPVRSLLERLDRLAEDIEDPAEPVAVTVPMEVHTVTWTAISPPRRGWLKQHAADPAILASAAAAGIEEVAAAVPGGSAAEQLVNRVRSEVWGRPISGLEHVPAGAAFAAHSLGFLADDPVSLYEVGPWTRLTMQRGHVLVKRRAWTLAR